MTDIIDQIQDEIKEEQKYNLFIKFFPYIVGIVVVFLVGFSIYAWNSSLEEERNEQTTLILFEYLQNNGSENISELSNKLKSIKNNKTKYLFDVINNSSKMDDNYSDELLAGIKNIKYSDSKGLDHIFSLISKEQEIVNNVGKIDNKELIKKIDGLMQDANLANTMSSRLKALKMVLQYGE